MPKSWYEVKAVAAPGSAEIFIYDEIGYWGVTAKDFVRDLKALGDVDHINLHINCPGGNVMDGTAIYNLLNNHPANITVYIDGWACSMGSVIAMVGDEIHMPANALMMIHNPWGGAVGESEDLRKMADVLDKVKAALVSTYMKRTGKPEEDISQLMDEETWLTGAEAVELGFADVLAAELDMAACAKYDLSRFGYNKVPNSIGAGSSNQPVPAKPAAVAAKLKPDEEHKMPDPITQNATAEEIAAAKKEAQATEQKRREGIRSAFKGHDDAHRDLLDACMDDFECSVEDAQAKLLNALGNQQKPLGAFEGARVLADGDKRYREDVVNALSARGGIAVAKADIANPMAGMSLYQLACMALDRQGVPYAGKGKIEIVGMAFQHGADDFGSLLADVATKSALKGYTESAETFQLWTSKGQLSDFKVAKRVDLNSFPALKEVPEGAEYKYATMGDRAEDVQLATYGRLFSITRQAIINDDLDVFTKVPERMGRAAKRTIGNLVYAILSGNPAMADGKALFHADHANLLTAAGITTSSVSAMRTKMRKQKEGEAMLDIRPNFLLCGVENEDQANTVRNSEFAVGGDENKTIPNSVRNSFETIADPRLGASEWFMAADQNMHDTIEVLYLDGVEEPRIEQQDAWNIDGTEFKVAIDVGVKATDYRGMAKNPGA